MFPKNGLKWLLLVQIYSIWVQNNIKYENGQNSPKQSWTNNLIFKYSNILDKYIPSKNICKFFLEQIYSDVQSGSFYHAEYVGILIRPISRVTSIFGSSFVQKKLYSSQTGSQFIGDQHYFNPSLFLRYVIFFNPKATGGGHSKFIHSFFDTV